MTPTSGGNTSAAEPAPGAPEGDLVDRVGVRLDPARPAATTLPILPAIAHAGQALAAPLMLAADVASGVRLHGPEANAVLTTSFSFRRTTEPTAVGDTVAAAASRVFRQGRRVVDSMTYTNQSGADVGFGQIGFVVRPGVGLDHDPAGTAAERRFLAPRGAPIPGSIIDAAGVEILDPAAGRIRLRLTPGIMRGGGILQGSFVTLMGEVAALAMGEHALDRPTIVTALDVHYLAGVHAQTTTTEGRWLGKPGAADAEIVLRDTDSDAVCATFFARVQVP